MSAELLKFPSLSLQYFKTITLICELYPDKICHLNPELQKNLMASLQLGLTGIGVDSIHILCCDFIQVSLVKFVKILEIFVNFWLISGALLLYSSEQKIRCANFRSSKTFSESKYPGVSAKRELQ